MGEKQPLIRRLLRPVPFIGAGPPRVCVIELNGVIGGGRPGEKGLTLARVERAIEAAFKTRHLAAVALAINSPGGSPVQSRLIHNAVRRCAEEKKTPVISFIEDVGASGGYILALAGDEIYADESSIVGSIGVISGGFGFTEAIEKLGVERRVHTAGESKSTLDPFKPEDPKDVERLQAILNDLHDQFIAMVRARRPGKLNEDEPIFTGAFWAAPKAHTLGLIDGTAQLGDLLRARFGKDVKITRVTPGRESLLRRLLAGGGGSAGLVDPDALIDAIERRAHWARFGR
ncbi:MAG: S49 family peptidase [Pseudomonadota bacterium]